MAQRKPRLKVSQPPPKPEPVTVEQVHPVTMATALSLADGDRQRLKVIDARTVLVVNR